MRRMISGCEVLDHDVDRWITEAETRHDVKTFERESASTGVFTDRHLSALTGTFVVPAYQRGYRWSETEVRQLLDDLASSPDAPYYLQPIVVKQGSELQAVKVPDSEWELVDGQQRLTTCYLVLAELHRRGLLPTPPPYQLRFATRPRSAEFLSRPGADRQDENIDFNHIARAQAEVVRWLAGHSEAEISALATAIDKRARVLWFVAPAHLSGEEMFRRLNSGRIPLSDAELVKALLLDKISDQREVEVAAQWDSFERDLRDEVAWGFLAGGRPAAAHINLLLEALADRHLREQGKQLSPRGDRTPLATFHVIRNRFKRDGGQSVWDDITQLHSMALSWVADNDRYHRIGYLIAAKLATFSSLVVEGMHRTQQEFDDFIAAQIRKSLPESFKKLANLQYDGGPDARKTLERALLMANSETVRRAKHDRFPWAQHGVQGGKWSLEHLRPQQPRPLNPQARKKWLSDHLEVLDAIESSTDVRPARSARAIRGRIDYAIRHGIKPGDFESLQQDVFDLLDFDEFDLEQVHSIANLALLERGHNSSLSNNAFEVKRRQIVAMDRAGQYVPIVTRNAFLKYYSTDSIPITYFWGRKDREDYAKALKDLLYPAEQPHLRRTTA